MTVPSSVGDDLRLVAGVGRGLEQDLPGAKRAPMRIWPAAIAEEQKHAEHRQKRDDGQQQWLARAAREQAENEAPAAATMNIIGRNPPNPSAAFSGSIGAASILNASRSFMEREFS